MWLWVANEKKKKTVNLNRRVLYKLQTYGKKNTFQTETRASREETKPFIQWVCDFFFDTHERKYAVCQAERGRRGRTHRKKNVYDNETKRTNHRHTMYICVYFVIYSIIIIIIIFGCQFEKLCVAVASVRETMTKKK